MGWFDNFAKFLRFEILENWKRYMWEFWNLGLKFIFEFPNFREIYPTKLQNHEQGGVIISFSPTRKVVLFFVLHRDIHLANWGLFNILALCWKLIQQKTHTITE